jgi:hypothetical protein
MVTIESLQPGQRFKIGKQRKFMTFKKAKRLQGEYVLSEHQGKILVILDNCRQIICEPDQEVQLEQNPNH